MDKAKMEELFGSDSEEEPEAGSGSQEVPASRAADDHREQVDADEIDEGDLFGSDDSDYDSRPSRAPRVPSAPPLTVELPEQPRPRENARLMLVRLPNLANILAIQPRPFDPNSEDCLDGELLKREGELPEGGDDAQRHQLKTENVIRWRENPVTGKRQSNARMVRWSDGSMTLHVGSEVLSVQSQSISEGSSQLFVRHRRSNLECHGVLAGKLAFQPASIHSNTHRALTREIAKSHKKENRIKMTPTFKNPEAKKREDERTWDEKNRLERKQLARARRDEETAPQLSADFLDADDDKLEGNIGAIKRGFKKAKKGKATAAPSRRAPRGTGAGSSRRLGPADDDDDDDDDWDREEQAAAASGEMDGFIVDSDDDEDEAEDSDEFEELESDDDDDEDRQPKKQSRR